jgi:hypothetical protein
MEAAQEAATALKFNRTIVGLARTIINGMRAAGVPAYNGAHLRLEKDARDWARILGGMPKYLGLYAKSFAAAGFGPSKDLYIASGLLSYNASAEMRDMMRFLRPHSKSVQVRPGKEPRPCRGCPLPPLLPAGLRLPPNRMTACLPPPPTPPPTQYKELYLPPGTLAGLNPEQEALIDFLVLAAANNFVGLGSSTFSVYLRWGALGGALGAGGPWGGT